MRPDVLTSQQVESIVALCLNEVGLRGPRDAALISLLWCGQFTIPQAVRLTTEAALRTVSPCGGLFADAVHCWARQLPSPGTPFLLTVTRQGHLVNVPMRVTTAAEIIRRRAAEAKAGYITPQELLRASILASRGQQPLGLGIPPGPCRQPYI